METQDVTTGCTGSDGVNGFRVETVVTNDPTNGLQAVIRYTSGPKAGLPGWYSPWPGSEVDLEPPPPALVGSST